MADPRVTVGITTYNVARYLPLAFDSLLAQDFADFEVVVCDNVSTDGTFAICERYADKDSRFRVYRNPENIGMSANYRRVVSLARGEFFRLAAHDDLLAPSLLRRCVEALDEAGPRAVLAYPLAVQIDGEGNEIRPMDYEVDWHTPDAWRRAVRMARVSGEGCNELFGVIRTDVLRRTRLMTPILSADVMLLAELAMRGEFIRVPERLFFRREHGGSTFHGGRDPREVASWLEPAGRPPRQAGRDIRIITETAKATLRSELPIAIRLSCAAAFTAAYGARRARTWAGRQRRRIT